jgi:plastocyanin
VTPRVFAVFASACLIIGNPALIDANGSDLKGTARSGHRSEPNAVVWLEAPGAPATPPAQRVLLNQRNLTFTPHVLAIRVGTTVDFPNEDRVFHNVFSFRDGKQFDLGIYPVGSLRRVTFSVPGVSRLFCNIHPNMAAYVVVVDSPYFAVADAGGSFTIRAVPPGKYVYRAWRPAGPVLTGSVLVQDDSPLDLIWP